MKTIALTLFAAVLGFAQTTSAPAVQGTPRVVTHSQRTAVPDKKPVKTPKQTPEQQAKAQRTQTQTILAGAKLVEPNLYRFTDSTGKTWNYRQTPFGVSKWEETSTPGAQAAPQPAHEALPAKGAPVVVTDLGDSYRFEKKTPFGASTWVHKKSELTDEEKALTEGQRTPSNPNQTSVNSKPAENQ